VVAEGLVDLLEQIQILVLTNQDNLVVLLVAVAVAVEKITAKAVREVTEAFVLFMVAQENLTLTIQHRKKYNI
jgi:hypothetical protein